jgi:alkylated DNA nucleotide flippase Atl1
VRAQGTTFEPLIQGQKQFLVPLYQRTFRWQLEQLRRLWDDILERVGDANGARETVHFLGSVVLAPVGLQAPTGIQRWIVVDGQQRLTTLMLAMCAIRDHLSATHPEERDRFNDLYLTNRWLKGDEYLRLMPTKADRASYLACVQSTAEAGGSDPIGVAYRFFRERLAAADNPSDPFNPLDVEAVIARRLALVEITADRDDNVHRIFESLNHTGLDLTQADLVRNQIFMLLPTRADTVYESIWLPLQTRLSPDQLEDLVYLHLVLSGHPRLRRDAIAEAMEGELRERRDDEAKIEGLVRVLERRSRHLERIVTPEHEPDEQLRAAFRRLNTWGAQVVYPLLMLLLDQQEAGRTSTTEVILTLNFVESFLVRRMICRVPTNNLNRIFNALVTQAPEDGSISEWVRQYLSRERNFWPGDDELKDAIKSKPFYLQGRPQQQQLVLRRLEHALGSKEPPDFEKGQYSVEHILPQSPTPEWLDMLSRDVEGDETPEELHRRLVHTLGNLTLTAYNSELSNNPFERKQDLFRGSGLEMNRRVASTPQWGEPEIVARADELAKLAASIWPAPIAAAGTREPGRDWSLLHQAMAAMPPGAWTSYGDLAALVGSHPVPVGVHLATTDVPNGHRALRADGGVSEGFRWSSPDDDRNVIEVLKEEGIRFDEDGHADPSQRLAASELAVLVGLDRVSDVDPEEWYGDPLPTDEGHRKFLSQLESAQDPLIAGAVQRLMDQWVSLGGRLSFGHAAHTSCFLSMGDDWVLPWLGGIYPAGHLEVAFKPMASRAPFVEVERREELRRRLNMAPGINIPTAKLALYPSFPLSVLRDSTAYEAVRSALAWFIAEVQDAYHLGHLPQESSGP